MTDAKQNVVVCQVEIILKRKTPRDSKIELSPMYDLLNSVMILNAKEEIALSLNGKKRNLDSEDFLSYFARERLKLTDRMITKTFDRHRERLSTLDRLHPKKFSF